MIGLMNTAVIQCPKCGYIRRPSDSCPDWQCPSCGIAYHKYAAYREKVKRFAGPRTAETGPAPVVADGSMWMLVATNVFVLVIALMEGWRLIDVMLVFWIQSIIIGISYVMRIASLDRFSTENFHINNRPVEPTPQTKWFTAAFFSFHYGFFHLIYAVFLFTGDYGDPKLDWDLVICAAAFAVNHLYSYRYHRQLDEQGTPNIGKLMFTPYARIVPMHLTIMLGATASGGVLLFGTLKIVADAVMHQVEHKMISHQEKG